MLIGRVLHNAGSSRIPRSATINQSNLFATELLQELKEYTEE